MNYPLRLLQLIKAEGRLVAVVVNGRRKGLNFSQHKEIGLFGWWHVLSRLWSASHPGLLFSMLQTWVYGHRKENGEVLW